MTQVYQRKAPTPRQAIRRKARLDKLLDPEMLKALAEPTRARLLSCLLKCGRPCSVSEVAACCEIDFSVVSRHLVTLARAGLLGCEKKGRTVWYTADGALLSEIFRELAEAVEEISPETCCDERACGC
ncbi:MAG: ArsR/SmtB family transcription factor [Planctomycetota bacterium]|jgi:ArsR family transcriptional regulator